MKDMKNMKDMKDMKGHTCAKQQGQKPGANTLQGLAQPQVHGMGLEGLCTLAVWSSNWTHFYRSYYMLLLYSDNQ